MIPIESLSLKGKHNIQNSMAAATVAQLLKITNEDLREFLEISSANGKSARY